MAEASAASWLRRARRVAGNVRLAARNAAVWMREGRIAPAYEAPHEIVLEWGVLSLRRYLWDLPGSRPEGAPPILLVPPLMVTANVYDISPELSAVRYLTERGLEVYVADFGTPEEIEGGLARTVDDHVLAVDRAVGFVRERTGKPVHLAGYSQGGMFAYLAAAYRRSADVASVVTFGSPVDMRRNLPVRMHEEVAARLLDVTSRAVHRSLSRVEALPGTFTSLGFKLLSPRQEIRHLLQTVGLLHDRQALAQREPKRRFLGGEGFVAWPGPAFRTMVTEFIANNRMTAGGVVLAGRTVSLADLTVPILYVLGTRDQMARPAAVRAIERVAASALVRPLVVDAGHFGLVVGTRAMTEVWPTVADWVRWHSGLGEAPEKLRRAEPPADSTAGDRLVEHAAEVRENLSRHLGGLSRQLVGVLDAFRWQLPRLSRLARMRDDTRVSLSRLLAQQARAIPDAPFFLWQGRAYTYREANERVSAVARGLAAAGVAVGQHVGVFMDNHPDALTAATALNRLGAVAVLLPAEARGLSLEHVLEAGRVEALVTDPEHLERARRAFARGPLLLLGARRAPGVETTGAVPLDELAQTAPDRALPWDAGRAADLAMLLFTSGTTGLPKAARITNRRAALAALGAAAACTLRPADTVYCCLPVCHATGMLVACGGALAGGARLALAPRFSPEGFWTDVRRAGATVVFYVGELCRYLVNAPTRPGERHHPVRLFAGSGMRADVWRRLEERFGPVRVLEFYSSTEGNALLVNLAGEKPGSVGRPLGNGVDVALVRYDVRAGEVVRDERGRCSPAPPGEPGLLLARIERDHPLGHFDGYLDAEATAAKVLQGVFEPGDAWFDTGDLFRVDEDGDYWFVDRVGDTFRWKGENVSTEQVTAVLEKAPFVSLATVYGVEVSGREGRVGMAAIELAEGAAFDGEALGRLVAEHLTPAARPRFVRIVSRFELTETLKVRRLRLAEEGADPARVRDPLYGYDAEAGVYRPLDSARYQEILSSPTGL